MSDDSWQVDKKQAPVEYQIKTQQNMQETEQREPRRSRGQRKTEGANMTIQMDNKQEQKKAELDNSWLVDGNTVEIKEGKQIQKDEDVEQSKWDEQNVQKPKERGNRETNRDNRDAKPRRRGNRNSEHYGGNKQQEQSQRGQRQYNQDRNKQFNFHKKPYNNNYERDNQRSGNDRGYRGGRGNYQGGRGNYQGGRGNRNYQGNRNNRGGQNRDDQDNRSNYQNFGNRNNQNRNYNRNQNQQRGNRNYNRQENDRYDDNQNRNKNQNNNNTQNNQNRQIQPTPRGRKCWPQSGVYVMKCHVLLTCRQIHEHRSDLLVIPYRSLKMQLYPGNVINSCKMDYRKKIESRGQAIKQPGSVYLQKCLGIDNFNIIGFLRVDDSIKALQAGIKQIFKMASQAVNIKIESILFPISQQLSNPQFVIEYILKQLEHQRYKFKNVTLTTKSNLYFIKAMSSFNESLSKMLLGNQICID